MRPGCAVDEQVEGHAGELFHVTVELAGQPGFQDGDVGPDKGSCHHRDGDARLLATGGEPVAEVLLGVPAQGGQVGLAGPGVAQAGPVQVGHVGRLFVRGGDGVPGDHGRRPALVGDALHQVLGEPVEDRELHGLFVGIVGVKVALAQVGPGGDVFHGDPVAQYPRSSTSCTNASSVAWPRCGPPAAGCESLVVRVASASPCAGT